MMAVILRLCVAQTTYSNCHLLQNYSETIESIFKSIFQNHYPRDPLQEMISLSMYVCICMYIIYNISKCKF